MDIALFGQPKAGKTSILRVIFSKVNPQQTILLESTQQQETLPVNLGDHIHLNIHDFPGSYSFNDPNPPEICLIEQCAAMIFVLDVQNEPYQEAYYKFLKALKFVKQHNQKCQVHFFIHKVDQDMFQYEDKKNDLLTQIKENVEMEMENAGILQNIAYHMTGIYDNTVFEAFSRVIQKVVPHINHIKQLLSQLVVMCKLEKTFLFEVYTKLCIATDTNLQEDLQNFSMCTEMIDVFIDISIIYGQQQEQNSQKDQQSSSMIKLNNGTILLLREVEKYLVLITIMKDQDYDRPFLVDYNIDAFKKGLKSIFDVKL